MTSSNFFDCLPSIPETTVSLSLQLTDTTVLVKSNLSDLRKELSDRLYPFIQVDSAARPHDITLIVTRVDRIVVPEMSRAEEVILQSHEKIARYNRTGLQLRRGDSVFTQNVKTGTCVMAEPSRKRIWIFGSDATKLVKDARRLVRDLHVEATKRAGYAVLHAGAVSRNGQGVLFLGASGSGKSSFLFDAVRIPGWDYIANDRVFCRKEGPGIASIKGAPEHILMRLGSLGRLEQLRDRIPREYAGMAPPELWAVPDAAKVSLQYRELKSIFGCEVISGGSICCIALPCFREEAPLPAYQRVTARRLLAELRASYDEAVEHRLPPWHGYWNLDFPALAANQAKVEEELASLLPAYALYRSGDSFGVTHKFLTEVPGRN